MTTATTHKYAPGDPVNIAAGAADTLLSDGTIVRHVTNTEYAARRWGRVEDLPGTGPLYLVGVDQGEAVIRESKLSPREPMSTNVCEACGAKFQSPHIERWCTHCERPKPARAGDENDLAVYAELDLTPRKAFDPNDWRTRAERDADEGDTGDAPSSSWGDAPPSTLQDVHAALFHAQQELSAVLRVHDEQKHGSEAAIHAWAWTKYRLEILQGALAAADVVFDVTVEFLADQDHLDVIRQYKAARAALPEPPPL